MKKLLSLSAAFIFLLLISFKGSSHEMTKSSAEAIQMEGLYIFFASRPIMETEYLGNIKVKVTWDAQTTTRLNAVIKKCKKDYPAAEAIIFKGIDFGSAEAVKYKK